MKLKFIILTLVFFISSIKNLSAHDFKVDGIYYNVLSETDKTVAVTYCGSYYDSYSNEYSGAVAIPETVSYSSTTYSVTSIGVSAFRGCTSLTEVTIPNSVISIGGYAFRGCSDLTSVTIPNSVTSIGGYAFYGCTGLTAVTIPNSVTSIGGYAFYHTGYWDNQPDGVVYLDNCLLGYNYTSSFMSDIEILDGTRLIADYAFYNRDWLVSVTIPNSVTSIGSEAFYDCAGLHSVTIGSGVLSIGDYAFYNTSIKKVIWLTNTPPEGYTGVSSRAHYVSNDQYTGLSNVTVYPYLSSLFEVDGVKYVPVSPSERTCDAIDCAYNSSAANINIGNTVSYKGIEMKLQDIKPYVCYNNDYITDCTIDYSENISNYAFYDCNAITNVNINASTIDSSAFCNCNAITDAEIKAKTIADAAFSGCSAITSADIKATTINDYAFSKCATMEPAIFSVTAETIGNYSFSACSSLETVTLSDNLTSIGSYAFQDCSSLKEVTIPDAVTSLGGSAFEGCSSLASAKIGSGISAINQKTFYGCSSLPEITIPANVNSIGDYVFGNCTSLANVTIADKIDDDNKTIQSFPDWISTNHSNSSTSYEEYTFNVESGDVLSFNYMVSSESGYDYLIVKLDGTQILKESGSKSRTYLKTFDATKEVTLYMSYTKDGSDSYGSDNASVSNIRVNFSVGLLLGSNGSDPMFVDCPLKTVYIGRDITYPTSSSYGYSPFYRNTSLETVVITDKETEISENEFYGCTALKSITMGDGVETIGNWAFSGCSSLDFFSFGSGMKSIGEEAFSDCTAMTQLYSNAAVPPTCGTQALDDINKWNCELFVPQASIADYQAADQWKEFFFIQDIESGVEDVIVDGDDYLNCPVEIYNLSGLKVGDSTEGLASGIYIKRQGRKVEKIAIQ